MMKGEFDGVHQHMALIKTWLHSSLAVQGQMLRSLLWTRATRVHGGFCCYRSRRRAAAGRWAQGGKMGSRWRRWAMQLRAPHVWTMPMRLYLLCVVDHTPVSEDAWYKVTQPTEWVKNHCRPLSLPLNKAVLPMPPMRQNIILQRVKLRLQASHNRTLSFSSFSFFSCPPCSCNHISLSHVVQPLLFAVPLLYPHSVRPAHPPRPTCPPRHPLFHPADSLTRRTAPSTKRMNLKNGSSTKKQLQLQTQIQIPGKEENTEKSMWQYLPITTANCAPCVSMKSLNFSDSCSRTFAMCWCRNSHQT